MRIPSVLQGTFAFFHHLPVIVEATALHLTSDAGLLPICQQKAAKSQRRFVGGGQATVREDPNSATLVRCILVSGRHLEACPLGHRQGGGEHAGHQFSHGGKGAVRSHSEIVIVSD
jgi:hypothetical protein